MVWTFPSRSVIAADASDCRAMLPLRRFSFNVGRILLTEGLLDSRRPREIGDLTRRASHGKNMHAGVSAVHRVDVAPFVHFHVVGLDRDFTNLLRALPHAAF